jgi:hypothetical protein
MARVTSRIHPTCPHCGKVHLEPCMGQLQEREEQRLDFLRKIEAHRKIHPDCHDPSAHLTMMAMEKELAKPNAYVEMIRKMQEFKCTCSEGGHCSLHTPLKAVA